MFSKYIHILKSILFLFRRVVLYHVVCHMILQFGEE